MERLPRMLAGVLTLGLLCALMVAQYSGARPSQREILTLSATFSPSPTTFYAQRDLLLQEEALFDAERAGFETPAGVAFRPRLSPADLGKQLAERARAGVIPHEEALHAAHAPRLILIADLIQNFHAEYAPSAPVEDALAGGAPLALAAPGGPVALFAPAAGSSAPGLRPRAPVAVSAATPASGQALQNYYSIRNGYAGRTADNDFRLSPLAPARRCFFAASSSSFLSKLDFTTAHADAPEFPV